MAMADRPEVLTASAPITALSVVGLAGNLLTGLAQVPLRRPWQGPSGLLDNIGRAVTRQVVRSLMGYSMGLPIEEFRSMEKVLDDICQIVMPPFVGLANDVEITEDVVGGVPGLWCRAKASTDAYVEDCDRKEPIGATGLYLHGGGYIGTSPMMYSAFAASLVRVTGAEIFIADYRMAPEFPFPAGVLDAAAVYEDLISRGVAPNHIVVAGDSGGGGLAASLMIYLHDKGVPAPAALVLFSPEVDLDFDHPSVVDNASKDILPWSIPVTPYLHGLQPNDKRVSIMHADPHPDWFPRTFVCWGADEMLRDGIREFVQRLRDNGIAVWAMEEYGMFHVFPILMPWAEASKRVFRMLDRLSRRHVRSDPKARATH